MTMTFSLHDSIVPDTAVHGTDCGYSPPAGSMDRAKQDMHILECKLNIPTVANTIERKRITDLLMRSVAQFPATLVTGRAGTGKTALAAAFAANFKKVSWYSVESTDSSWPVFSKYFASSLRGSVNRDLRPEPESDDGGDQREIAKFMFDIFGGPLETRERETSLIVLDDIHHLFNVGWFDHFFNLLVPSLPAGTHILMLCRSKPPSPLWRMRSKQMLNVIDERVIAFSPGETETLFEALRLPTDNAKAYQQQSFGRISKILRLAEDQVSALPSRLA
jgi:LuxR family transcriptional regulator, maltose regulon positive regulatory protein